MKVKRKTTLELLDVAKKEAKRSACQENKVGAALAFICSDGFVRLISTGYGGPVNNTECPLDSTGKCPRKYMTWAQDGCWSIHAEQRALFASMPLLYRTCTVEGKWVMIVTHGPCDQCLKFMHYFGVSLVLYEIEYNTDYTKWGNKLNITQIDKYMEAPYDV